LRLRRLASIPLIADQFVSDVVLVDIADVGDRSGGILAMLSNSLIPFAHERSWGAGFWTVVGFCASFAMS